jgi:hypothetical protein
MTAGPDLTPWQMEQVRLAESDVSGAYLREVTLTLCLPCLSGAGGECHTPGCDLWLHRAPDIPVFCGCPDLAEKHWHEPDGTLMTVEDA